MTNKRSEYEIIGAAFDLGSPARGCALAPKAIRDKGLLRRLLELKELGVCVTDGGDEEQPEASNTLTTPKNLHELLAFSGSLMERLRRTYQADRIPVVIGGDHAISIPSVSAAAAFSEEPLGLLWGDAHPDLDTPESWPDGDLHGMSVAHLLGFGHERLCKLGGRYPKLKPEHVVFIGLRDVSSSEKPVMREHNFEAYTFTDIERLGIVEVCQRAFSRLSKSTSAFVLSFDIDVCSPREAPGVQYPNPGGLTYREAHVLMQFAAEAKGLISLEMVEVNPTLDKDGATSNLAIELIRTALGAKTI